MSTTRGVVQLKMTLMGSAATGKSSLITRIRGHEGPLPLTKPTIFQEISAVHYDGDDDLDDEEFPRVIVNLFDSSGQEKISMSSIARTVYRSSHIVWLVFAVDNRESLAKISAWYAHVSPDVNEDYIFVLVGNKCDLQEEDDRQISTSEAASFAAERGFPFFETSARDATNVKSTFEFSVREAIQAMKKSGSLDQAKKQQEADRMKRQQGRGGAIRPSNPRGGESQSKKEEGTCCK